MTRLFLSAATLGLLLAAGSAPAPASTIASAAPDPRLVARRYDPDRVVRIDGRAGVQAAIAFGQDEHIENVAIGDANAWQVTPNKRANMLFVKPLAAAARTNLTVITDRHAYHFDLVASASSRPLYVLRFTYPDEPEPSAQPGTPELTAEEGALARGRAPAPAPAAEPATDPASLNFAWKMKGKARLFPARLYDDGASVYLAWNPDAPVPAILTRDDKGAEGPVNYAVRGSTIVVEGAPRLLLLRAGRDMATLVNQAPAAPQAPPPASDSAPALAATATGD